MIKIGKKILGLIVAVIDWSEILDGFLLILLGLTFTRYYGYQVLWSDYLNICLWYLFFKSAIFCLSAVLSGEIYQNCTISNFNHVKLYEFRELVVKYFWVITIAFFAISFLPLYQLIELGRLNSLSLAIISLIYLGNFIFLIKNLQEMFAGLSEVFYGFATAFLLPALCFSLSINHIKSSMILVTFPLFLQFAAMKTCQNLECRISGKKITDSSLVEVISIRDALYTITALFFLGSATIFLDVNFIKLTFKLLILALGAATAWLTFRSIKKQHPNWERALILARLLPLVSVLLVIFSLWKN